MSLRQRPIPPGLVPFIPVLVLVLVLIASLVEPVAGIALLAVFVVVIIRVRYRQVKDIDYVTLRRTDLLYRALAGWGRGRNRYDDRDPDDPSA